MSLLASSDVIEELNNLCGRDMHTLTWLLREPKGRAVVFTDKDGRISKSSGLFMYYKRALLNSLCDKGFVKRASRGSVHVYRLHKKVEVRLCAMLIANELEGM